MKTETITAERRDPMLSCPDNQEARRVTSAVEPMWGFHYPADDFWQGAFDALLAAGWTGAEARELLRSKYIRHSWGDGPEVSTLERAGAAFIRRVIRDRRVHADVQSWMRS